MRRTATPARGTATPLQARRHSTSPRARVMARTSDHNRAEGNGECPHDRRPGAGPASRSVRPQPARNSRTTGRDRQGAEQPVGSRGARRKVSQPRHAPVPPEEAGARLTHQPISKGSATAVASTLASSTTRTVWISRFMRSEFVQVHIFTATRPAPMPTKARKHALVSAERAPRAIQLRCCAAA